MNPKDLRYTKDHEWVRIEGETATIGITSFATEQLGDIVYVELPSKGSTLAQGATFGVVESVKAVSDLFAPISGEVVETNEGLSSQPELVNQEPYGAGWMLKVKVGDAGQLDDLLDAAGYDALNVEA